MQPAPWQPSGLHLRRVALLAVIIRLAHFALLIALDQLLRDYDTSSELHSQDVTLTGAVPLNGEEHASTLATSKHTTTRLFSSLLVWDSVFFAEIARQGYEYEQYYAFFPLLPYLSSLLGPAWIPIMAHSISLVCSVLMAVLFAQLSSHVLQQPSSAAAATLLLMLGQACVFHTIAYTESVFGALTMAGLYFLYCMGSPTPESPPTHAARRSAIGAQAGHPAPSSSTSMHNQTRSGGCNSTARQQAGPCSTAKSSSSSPAGPTARSLIAASLAFTLASCTRSNGVINCGYIAHSTIGASIQQWQHGRRGEAAASLAMGAVASVIVVMPVAAFQLHGYVAFCCQEAPVDVGAGVGGEGRSGLGSLAGLLRPLHSLLRAQGACGPQPACGAALEHVSGGCDGTAGDGAAAQSGGGAEGCKGRSTVTKHGADCARADESTGDGLPAEPSCAAAGALPQEQEHPRHSNSVASPPRPWCTGHPLGIYSFVQRHYWGVGLLRYWRLQQLPNFLLAAPALLIAAAGCWTYAASNPALLLSGGWPHLLPQRTHRSTPSPQPPSGFLSPGVAVHIYPWAFMALYALLVMHVQVATRFLSCCPAHYWYLAHLTGACGGASGGAGADARVGPRGPDGCSAAAPEPQSADATTAAGCSAASGQVPNAEEEALRQSMWQQEGQQGQQQAGRLWRLVVWGCCWSYTVIGSVMLPNFYPWT